MRPAFDLSLEEATELAAFFDRRVEAVGREAARRVRLEVEEFRSFEAPEVWVQVATYAIGTRAAVADAVRLRRLPSGFPADEMPLRLGYDGGASLRTMLQSYRIGQAVAAEVWADAVINVVAEGSRVAALSELTAFLFRYEDCLIEWMHSEWERFSQQDDSSPARLQLTRRVLEGDVAAASGFEYDLTADHIAAIAWGPDALRELTRMGVASSGPSLVMRATEEICWGWYSRREWGTERLESGESVSAGDAGIAIGGPGAGVDGFRRSHEEAGDAYVVARRTGRSIVGYGDVSIEALAIQNEAAARRFVTHALGDLEGEGRRVEVLRDTLRAYYRHGQNGAATAQDLEVHEQTVARRLASAAQLLRSHPSECRAEVETALRIREMLGARGPAEFSGE